MFSILSSYKGKIHNTISCTKCNAITIYFGVFIVSRSSTFYVIDIIRKKLFIYNFPKEEEKNLNHVLNVLKFKFVQIYLFH